MCLAVKVCVSPWLSGSFTVCAFSCCVPMLQQVAPLPSVFMLSYANRLLALALHTHRHDSVFWTVAGEQETRRPLNLITWGWRSPPSFFQCISNTADDHNPPVELDQLESHLLQRVTQSLIRGDKSPTHQHTHTTCVGFLSVCVCVWCISTLEWDGSCSGLGKTFQYNHFTVGVTFALIFGHSI